MQEEEIVLSGAMHRLIISEKVHNALLAEGMVRSEKPASGEIAEEVGMNSAVLGRLLTKHEFPKPINTTRGAGAERLPGKFYTVDQIPEIGGVVHVLAGELKYESH